MKAARGDAGEHLLEHEAAERVAIGKVVIGAKPNLRVAVGAAHARTLDSDASPAERHLAVLMTVSDRVALSVPLALGADHVVDLLLHQLAQNAEPDTDAQRKQALLRRSDELPERFLNSRR